MDHSGRNNFIENHGVKLVGDGSGYFDGKSHLVIPRFANMEFDNLVVRVRFRADPDMSQMAALVSNSDCCHYAPTFLMLLQNKAVHLVAVTKPNPELPNMKMATFSMPLNVSYTRCMMMSLKVCYK